MEGGGWKTKQPHNFLFEHGWCRYLRNFKGQDRLYQKSWESRRWSGEHRIYKSQILGFSKNDLSSHIAFVSKI